MSSNIEPITTKIDTQDSYSATGGIGGTCLNHGCIPSKALLTASNLVTDLESASRMGIYAEPFVDVGELIDWKDDVVDRLTGGVEKLCEANGVTVREGTARFTAGHTAEIDPGDGATVGLEFENAIVATGSRPMEIPGFPFDATPILNSRQALALETPTGGGPGRSTARRFGRDTVT